MRALLAAVAAGAALIAAAPAFAQHAGLPPALAEAAHAYEKAQIEGDRAELERLIAEDFILVGSDGSRTGKREHIGEFTAPGLDLNPVIVREPVEHVWHDGAALGGTVDVTGTFEKTPIRSTLRYIDVWALRDGRWVVVYGQATRIPSPPPAN
ncbi:MAG TPA: nuclear transport factor 2 family protein [Caulobacteraceae bacterium]|nr:nuclear transport factor 2 family protein [Caulobacteraceae bacterium]